MARDAGAGACPRGACSNLRGVAPRGPGFPWRGGINLILLNHLDKLCSCIERGLDVHELNGVVGLVRGGLPMPRTSKESTENPRVLLGLLDAVEQDGAQSQRLLAAELGIALGLVNAYLKRCVKKGLVKVSEAPARRYAYYLTPQGLAEKSRPTIEYLSYSFGFFRQAKTDCSELFRLAAERGIEKIVLVGQT